MFELLMAAGLSDFAPTIGQQSLYDFPAMHPRYTRNTYPVNFKMRTPYALLSPPTYALFGDFHQDPSGH